jgi:hypothetical protein
VLVGVVLPLGSYALSYCGDGVSSITVAPRRYLPVASGDHLPARGCTASALHPEACCDGLGCVVHSEFFACADIAPCRECVRIGVPKVRIAAVVAVMDELAGREDQVGIVVDADGVQVTLAGRGGLQQPVKFIIGDQPASQGGDGSACGEGLGSEQAAPLDDRGLHLDVRVQPTGVGPGVVFAAGHVPIVAEGPGSCARVSLAR